MSKNYRQLKRDEWEKSCLHTIKVKNKYRRKVNRLRYQEHAEAKKQTKLSGDRTSGFFYLVGNSPKLHSSRRFINYHQRNFW